MSDELVAPSREALGEWLNNNPVEGLEDYLRGLGVSQYGINVIMSDIHTYEVSGG